jgi:quercetin dioxygenase-like cupin family protein
MRKIFQATTFILLFLVLTTRAQTLTDTITSSQQQAVFKDGDKAPANAFTGDVWVKTLFRDTASGCVSSRVSFAPGARSHWHVHPDKQVVIVTNGSGYYQEKNKPLRVVSPGDVITVGAGVEHWHGANADIGFTQIVVNFHFEKGVVTWLNKVTDEEYKSLK